MGIGFLLCQAGNRQEYGAITTGILEPTRTQMFTAWLQATRSPAHSYPVDLRTGRQQLFLILQTSLVQGASPVGPRGGMKLQLAKHDSEGRPSKWPEPTGLAADL